jgi:hypothetical protein
VGFVDDDRVPVALVRPDTKFGILLEGIDRDDGLVVVVERVGVGRDAATDALISHRVETDERNREARPELLLELGHHALGRDDEDAFALASGDELTEQDADLDGLAEADGVGLEDPLAGLFEGQQAGSS